MITVDSSVAIAAFASWHEQHRSAVGVLEEKPLLVGHTAVEIYSVLTRLPPPHRADSAVVAEFLRVNFTDEFLTPTAERLREFIGALPAMGVKGGASYDALIAFTAREHGAELITADVRAMQVYRSIGVRLRFLS